ncbi:hypothetical protein GH714_016351 [Hevea brasiliensis]|uniref:Leucine-rich repeat-containing N-terminal plant-type domain-containing protein n=1 Tax=Hevea brasiliensis TaxID=3981 RepID=A0A6A6K4W5_HEVBR|nr:hypothetical protein GH714_016351 [Hevea brasiliensis]
MDFSSNKFSGPIAPEISQCKLLTFVDLSRNELSGAIPTEITGMRILNYLNLSRNHFVGSIPSSIATMQSLTSVDFSYNNLTGLVPGTGQFSYFNYTSFLGNPDLCGPYLGPCKDGDANGTHQAHVKGPLSASLKLLLVIGLLVCSIAFAVAAIIKARSLKKASESRAWKLTAFQRLDFTVDDVLDCLKEDNIIGTSECMSAIAGSYGYMLQAIERPTMREVVQILTELPKPPSSKQGDSTITDSSPQSATTLDSPNATTKDPKDHQQPPTPQSPPPDLLSI